MIIIYNLVFTKMINFFPCCYDAGIFVVIKFYQKAFVKIFYNRENFTYINTSKWVGVYVYVYM